MFGVGIRQHFGGFVTFVEFDVFAGFDDFGNWWVLVFCNGLFVRFCFSVCVDLLCELWLYYFVGFFVVGCFVDSRVLMGWGFRVRCLVVFAWINA